MIVRELKLNFSNLRSEMDMRDKEWSKFSKDVKNYVQEVLKPKGFIYL